MRDITEKITWCFYDTVRLADTCERLFDGGFHAPFEIRQIRSWVSTNTRASIRIVVRDKIMFEAPLNLLTTPIDVNIIVPVDARFEVSLNVPDPSAQWVQVGLFGTLTRDLV